MYGYDANGNRLTIKDANGGVSTFAYDGLNRQIRRSRSARSRHRLRL